MITENTLNLLEFPKLLRIISTFSHSDASEKAVLDILPLSDREEMGKRLGRIAEIRRISHEGSPLKLSQFSDVAPLLHKIRPEGAVLESRELSAFMPFLAIVNDISSQMKEQEALPFLTELTGPLTGFPHIFALLNKSMDSEGNILDSASFALSELRGQVRRLEGRITKKLEEMTRDERISVFLQDNFITERSGRWVIPVRMDSKGQVPGVVHDVSRSGETAFIEPLAIISLSNELENLIAEQKAEEIRILRDICSKIRAVADEMDIQYGIIVYLDLLNCIARFADELTMENPEINEAGFVRLVNGRHPLLMLSFRKSDAAQEVVPLDVLLGVETTVMVITGSNAGGKTIAIKTIGLLQLMALSGMPVAADSSSSFPLVHDLLIDIGDEQSIENNLSTFSAHVSNISSILKKADAKSLVLIDELGTGTDPEEGAALACAVLKEVRNKGALLFATTHLTDIKGFVHRTEGMINASMEFDRQTLTPLYRLRVGEPGQSHALEIARRYGLPDSIIDSAKAMLGGIKVEFDNLIADLNAKRAQYENALREINELQAETGKKNRLLEQRLAETETRQKELLAKAYQEASDIIADTKRQMNALLEEIRKKGREKSREAIKQAEARREEVVRKLREYDVADRGAPLITEIKEGDVVFVRSFGYDASVMGVDAKHNRLRVRSGSMEIEVPVADIGFKRGKSAETKGGAVHIERTDETVSSRLNLVGMRVDEALSKLEPFLNHASLAGLSEVTIIHGFGTGILAKAVRQHLEGHPLVKRFRKGEQSEGGAGVTIVMIA
ncbi:MAG: endonuclease MutS2 [Nitrospirae bacterium]|nr:endonuclease MutS2 [Nitrospirota bacterium]MCL5422152.1 endonuclease MutS2 [Nitrospirota bacterium]